MRNLGVADELDEACRAFRLWHQKEPSEVFDTDYPLEEYDVFLAGTADEILYVSDKWEDDGRMYDYIHDFDSAPSVFTTEGYGDEEDPAELLRVPKVAKDAEASLPILAAVKRITIVRDDGSKHQIRFREPPMLCCSLDKKCLVILTEDVGPIYIRGGRMHVTARGIHH